MRFIRRLFETLADMLNNDNSNKKKLELFDLQEYNFPKHINYKKCPNCGFESHTNAEIQKYFGIKQNNNYAYFQSWCKECRKKDTIKIDKENEDFDLFD